MDMTRKLILAAWALLFAAAVPAQQKEEFRLWPEAGKYAPERLGAGFDRDNAPYVTLYRPEGKKPAPAVVVCPGGAYGGLAIGHEGYQVAEWFAARGFAAVVLKYTMPHGNYDLPRRDVQQAIELVRANAAGWGADPARVGVIGFSAGGHLASTAATHFTCDANRPDFAVLVYPVVSMNYSSVRTRENLLGARSEEEALRKRHSTFGQVHEGMPEVMLLLCNDDKAVVPDNSIAFYRALNRRGVKAEMHIYPEGGHGFWMRERYKYGDETYPAVIRWIERHRTNN